MSPNRPKTATVTLHLIHFSEHSDLLAGIRCLACQRLLEMHQPDVGFPERMLGICPACKSWYLMDLVQDEPEAVMVTLPDGNYFRDALQAR